MFINLICHAAIFTPDVKYFTLKVLQIKKHTIIVDLKNINYQLYSFEPKIEIRIEQMYQAKGLIGENMQILGLGLLGAIILFLLMIGLLKELIVKIYKRMK
jgi:hypothetical protein